MRLVRVVGIALILAVAFAGPAAAGGIGDLGITKTDAPDPVAPGGTLTYTITVVATGTNASDVLMSDTLPAGTTFQSLTSPGGWALTAPAIGGTGTVTAEIATMFIGSAVFTLVVQVDAGLAAGTVITNTASVSSESPDSNQGNNSSTATTTVAAAATPTPAASLNDAAMAPPTGSPIAALGFGLLLLGALIGTAVLAVRRVRA
jgi:uncharacterized repeat protein (TIGR01451 family)